MQRGRPYHTLAIIFTNTDFEVLGWLQDRWGGNIFRPTQLDARRRPYGHLRFSAGPARPLLKAMLPYLIVKKSQVEIALEFIDSRGPNRGGRQGDPEATAKRAALAARMPRPRARLKFINSTFSDVPNRANQQADRQSGSPRPTFARDAPG